MRIKRAVLLALALIVATTGVVFGAFTASLQATGTWNDRELRDFIRSLKEVRDLDQSQVRIIEVTNLDAAGTGWHVHPGSPSLLMVETGTVAFIEPDRRGNCVTTTLAAGSVISHPTSVHDIRAVGGLASFTVVYFSAVGATLTVPTTDPCGAGGGGGGDGGDGEGDGDDD